MAQSGDYIATLSRPGFTLEGLDSVSTNIDALAFSLDDVALSALPKVAIVDSSHRLGFCTGANLEATLDTSEQALDGRRLRAKGLRPITDATTCYGSIGARESTQGTVTFGNEHAVNDKGLCPTNVSTRLARARLRIPAGVAWSFASGIEPAFAQEGRR